LKPPLAPRAPVVKTLHGDTRTDDYSWLRDRENPEVRAYLEAENAYTEACLAPLGELREGLYREMLARIQETDMSVPYREGSFFYYSRTVEGLQYPILCRKAGSLEAAEEIVLDLNEEARGHPFLSLGVYAFSDDGTRLAYSLDVRGFREYTLYVKDLRTGQRLAEPIERTGVACWASDGATLFYTVEDEAKRPHRLYRRRLGADAALLFEEQDEHFRLSVGRTRSRAFLIALSASHTTTEARFAPADRPEAEWRLVAPREPEHEYDVDHRGESFFIRTNDRGRNFRLVTAPVEDPSRARWTEKVPHRPEVMLEGVELFRDHAVLLEREGGLPHFAVLDLRSAEAHRVAFPEPTYTAAPGANAEFDTARFRFSYQSLVTPASVFDYDMEARTSTLLKEQPVLGGYDKARYVSERREAEAEDGTRVPISLVYRQGTPEGAPMLLAGYGAYGYPYPVTFSSARLSLLDRGVMVAIAHVRGGGEMGKAWHDQGRLVAKRNTFTDFISCAEWLVANGYTRPDRLVVQGGSAGGLLMGAVLNLRPELFHAAVVHVPFVDVLNTMLDASLPLTVGEYEEWGNPEDPEYYRYIKSYCPYTNLAAKPYPAMLVKTSLHDSQVMYWEPAKYVAKLRTLKTDDRRLVLHTNLDAGHGGASGRYDALKETAFDYAFVLGELALTDRRA
jgi:oligopeptidase B